MPRDPIPTWYFVLVAVRKSDRFLLIRELKRGQPWYLPAGRVEPGESFSEAARRETLEEAGLSVEIDGVIRFEHTPLRSGARVRVILAAHPLDDRPPKDFADEHSVRAAWVTPGELDGYLLRGPDARAVIEYLAHGEPIFPLQILAAEGDPF